MFDDIMIPQYKLFNFDLTYRFTNLGQIKVQM